MCIIIPVCPNFQLAPRPMCTTVVVVESAMEIATPKSIEEMFKVLCDSMNKVSKSTLELQNEVREMKESIKANYDDLTGKLDALIGRSTKEYRHRTNTSETKGERFRENTPRPTSK